MSFWVYGAPRSRCRRFPMRWDLWHLLRKIHCWRFSRYTNSNISGGIRVLCKTANQLIFKILFVWSTHFVQVYGCNSSSICWKTSHQSNYILMHLSHCSIQAIAYLQDKATRPFFARPCNPILFEPAHKYDTLFLFHQSIAIGVWPSNVTRTQCQSIALSRLMLFGGIACYV